MSERERVQTIRDGYAGQPIQGGALVKPDHYPCHRLARACARLK